MKFNFVPIIIMLSKWAAYGFCIQLLFFNMIIAGSAVGQKTASVKEVEITLDLRNSTISKLFKEIETKTDFRFSLDRSELKTELNNRISITDQNIKVADVLMEVSKYSGIKFKQVNNNINVRKIEKGEGQSLSLEVVRVMKDIDISGKITDENGEGLPGASVVIKGTSTGTTTDLDGNYKITVLEQSVLVVSFVGYRTHEMQVGSQSVVDIQMELDAEQLDEVVVVGYGTQKKDDLTGSVVRVKTEQTQDMLNSNVLQSLKGTVPGLVIGTPNRPGGDPGFRIRGRNSITADNGPLIILDGIIYNGSLNSINVGDIEAVDVLKDASAAAVYGSRSANGVIIITTKKGTSEAPTFNFKVNYGLSNPTKLISVLDGPGYIQKILDFREAKGLEADPANITDYLNLTEANNYNQGKTIDWYDELVNQSVTQNYNLSVSGKSAKTNYFISTTYFDQKGIVENDNFDRITTRINLTNEITDWYRVHFKSSYSSLDYSGVEVPLSYALSPYSDWWEDEENGILKEFPMEDPYYRHPFMNLQIDNSDKRRDLWGLISSEMDIPFVSGLKWTLNYSVNERSRRLNQFSDNTLARTTNGSATKQLYDNYDWTLDNILNYQKDFGQAHSLGVTMLYSREYHQSSQTIANSSDFFNQKLGYDNLGLGAVQTVSSNYGDHSGVGLMARLNYVYEGTYALTATVRKDGYSGFATDNKYATFKSVGLGWTVTNEAFMQGISWLNRMKLRLSYGENGNQAIGRYQTLARLANRDVVYGDGGTTSNGVFVNSIANSDLSWETSKVYNLGLEFAVLKNRLSGTIDYYSSNTVDLLLNRKLPRLSGFSSVLSNVGEVHNHGLEIALNSVNIKTSSFSWETGLVWDLKRNRIEKLYGQDLDGDGVEDDDISNRWFIGQPLGVIYGYAIDGIHQLDDDDIPQGYQPGDFRIVDYDGDGELTPDDRHILGNGNANYQYSVFNTFKYKNFSLYVMVNAVKGGGKDNYYVGNNINMHNPNAPFGTFTERFSFADIDYWTPDNPSNTVARIDYIPVRGHAYLEDRSFVRIQDVNLAYRFDNAISNKIGLKNLRVYTSIKNLHTFSKWSGYDPQNATSIGGFPLMRTVTFGIDASF